jgi:hypothetical protein
MADYSDEEGNQARRVVERLIDLDEEIPELDADIVVSDLEADASEFAAELELFEQIQVDAPAVRIADEPVPIALSALVGAGSSWLPLTDLYRSPRTRRVSLFRDWLFLYLSSLSDRPNLFGGIETIPREQARATFLDRAAAFLAIRISAVRAFDHADSTRWSGSSPLWLRQRVGGPRVSTPGCLFTVSTNSSGLRVFWSGVYRISANYFNHPTTPTNSVLQSGTYVFGVDGGAYGSQIQWDNAVVTLPGNPHAHLNF